MEIHGDALLQLIKDRQSERGYLPNPVEPEKLMRCLEAARLAPSACNAQPWKFIVIDDPGLREQVATASSDALLPLNHFVSQAPVLVAFVMEKPNFTSKAGELIKDKKFTLIDLGIAAAHFCLQAQSEGLGTCMLGWFKEEKIKKLLHIPSGKRLILIITLGYPSGKRKRLKIRKPSEEVVARNTYS
jgi:nitroreductase